ncbi:MAG: HYR domain-containing protein, partial [Bacteroidetes bacterium]
VTSIDNQNQVGTCNFNVNVNPPPGGCCPASLQLSTNPTSPTCPGGNDGSIDLSVGAGTAPYNYSWSNGANTQDISGLMGGSFTVNVSDVNGCTDMLTVNLPDGVDNTAPSITCPANITATATSSSGATVTYTPPVGTDNCTPTTNQTGGLASGSTFPIGITTNQFTVTDQSGLFTSCSFTVTVSGVGPDIQCPGNITVNTDPGQCNAVVNFAATENTGIPPSSISYSHNPGSTFQVGTVTVTATATNTVGSDQCTFDITVEDNEAPNALCKNTTVQLNASGNGSITAADVNNGSNDACGIANLSVQPSTFGCGNVGNNTVTLTVTDINGQVSTCTATVNVQDNVAPNAVCQNTTVQLNANGSGSITAADVDGGSNDACGIGSLSVQPSSFGCGNIGNNTVTLTVTDNNNQVSTCTATVNVQDNSAPVPNVPSLPTVTAECGTDVSAPTATDNCAGQVTGTTNDQVSFNEQGTYTINWTYNDGNGNSSSQNQTVIIDDVTPPEITCPQNITSGTDAGFCGASVPFDVQVSDNCSFTYVCTIGGEEASDCYGNIVTLTLNLDDFPSETTWMLMDGNGIVLESGGPYFTPGATITETFTLADGDYMFMIKDAFGDGICCLFGEGSYTLTSNGEEIVSGGEFAEGEKTNFCVEAQSGGGGMPLTEIESGHFFPVGTTTVTCTVTDAGGNTDVCTFDVTVNDTEAPMIATPCPGTITRCGAQTVSWTPPTATDNCAVVSTVSNYNPGDFFTVGTHTVTYTFSDAAGLSVSCSFDVVINPLPEVEITQDDLPTWCQGIKVLTAEVLNPEVLTFPLTYNWSDGLGNASQVIAPANGTYFVTVTDALGCFTVESTTIDVDISTLLSAYTIISGEEFEMYLSDVIGGGVGIEDADEAEVALNSNIFTFFRADADNVQVDGSSFINNFIDADFNIPFPAFQSNPFNNFNNVNVAGNSTMTLSGTNYGNVYVGFGATLIIDNADIHLRSLTTAKDATIIFNQPTEMKIRRKMYIGETNTVNPDGHTIVIFVSDNASVGQGSNVIANIYAPEGLDVNDSGSSLTTYMTGMFISNDRISSDHNVVWNWNLNCSYLPDTQPPIIDYSEQIDVNTPESSITDKDDFNVYPNPTAGLLNIDVTSFLDESMEIEMFNALGEIVWRQKVDRLETTLITAKMTNLADGVYFLQVTSNGKRLSKQIILSR